MYKAMTEPKGWTNPVKVRCSQCHATLYVNQTEAKRSGGWECPLCGKRR
jgi:DNA-directed RNA polymerase subunit RPC12/RpoP